MNKVKKLLVLLGILLVLTSCKISEPKLQFCVLNKVTECTCFDGDKDIVKPIKECLGYLMLSPDDFGLAALHHDELHIELDLCE